MNPANDLNALSQRFVERISVAKGRVRLVPFERAAWFQCAYASIQRTILGGLSRDIYAQLSDITFDAVYALRDRVESAENHDVWVIETMRCQCDTAHLSVGQAQKLINLLLAYYFCYYHTAGDPAWNEEHRFIAQHGPFFHVPIDNYLLIVLKVVYACPDIHINRAHTAATIRIDDALISWSRLADVDAYMRLQHFIQEIQGNHLRAYDIGLHFALAELALAQ
jgi:hypothetical protein